tara:strand:- start:8228 stop:9013 length:786 start_codon:yes stop_codon:yes gene_type:complete
MQLELKRPIVFFDLETTGLQISNDRIVEICVLKIFPDGKKELKEWLINPTIPISIESVKIHGITDDNVKNKPTFKEISKELYDLIDNCDFGGYNLNRFDIPILAEEFIRADIDFNMNKRKSIDVQNIFHKLEQRTLVAAYKFYCNKNLENAHSAKADTKATYEILLAQVNKYNELNNDINFLSEYSQKDEKFVDLAGFIRYNEENKEILSFGKYRNSTLEEIWQKNPGYFSWFNNAEFPEFTKKIVRDFVIKMKLINKFKS